MPLISAKRLADLLSRYGQSATLTPPASPDSNKPWQIAAARLQPVAVRLLLHQPHHASPALGGDQMRQTRALLQITADQPAPARGAVIPQS